MLNHGKFDFNNRSGYLLKPEIMRNSSKIKNFDPFSDTQLNGIVPLKFKIRVRIV